MHTTTCCTDGALLGGWRIAAALLLFSPIVAYGFALPGTAVTIPQSGNTVIATIPDQAAVAPLERARRRLAQHPENLQAATALARRYMALGSRRGQPRYYGYAQAALEPWWDQPNPPAGVALLKARHQQYLHHFKSAVTTLTALLERQPNNGRARLLRSSVYRVLGHYQQATADCRQLGGRIPRLVQIACLSDIQALTGDPGEARSRLTRVLSRSSRASVALRQWGLTVLGEIKRLDDDLPGARKTLKRAMSLGAPSVYLRGAYSDVLLAIGQPKAARRVVAGHGGVDPLLLRLAIAERRFGDPAWRKHRDALAERFRAAARRGDSIHWRERARHALELLDDPQRALSYARRNWEKQHEPADARLLAATAHAADNREALAALRQWSREHGLNKTAIAQLTAAEVTL